MADVRLIDANALVQRFSAMQECANMRDHVYLMGVLSVIDNAPTIDAVQVVRCRECYYRDKPSCCPYQYSGFKVEPDWYCPMGVKMDAKEC